MISKIATITKIFMVVALAVIIGWDIIAAVWGDGCSTISCIGGKTWSYSYSTIPLAWGVLTGHLLWITREEVKLRWLRFVLLGVLATASIVLDIVDFYDVIPIVPSLIGVPLGRLLWPQCWPDGHPLVVWKR